MRASRKTSSLSGEVLPPWATSTRPPDFGRSASARDKRGFAPFENPFPAPAAVSVATNLSPVVRAGRKACSPALFCSRPGTALPV
ncbi:hypothetical protein BREVNS_2022 [Brevinematales bacterium NS]|nr:hypothetical protein BREVNS_2022 [Brevinematales bacterium NS]